MALSPQAVRTTTGAPQSTASPSTIEALDDSYAIDLGLTEIKGANAYRLTLAASRNIPGVLVLDENAIFEDEVALRIKELKDKIIKKLDVKAVTAKLLKNTK